MKRHYDIAIVGSGFAGSLMAMIARRLGHSVALVERGRHPRVVIGESSTPFANLLLEELSEQYDLPFLRPLTKWGTWQRTYPHLACGLKRGFSFFHHDLDKDKPSTTFEERQLIVAASPHDEIADTQWFRSDFDQFLVEQAKQIGVNYFDQLAITACARVERTWRLSGRRHSERFDISASFLVDATGPRGFLHHSLNLGEKPLPMLQPTSAFYAHFSGVGRIQDMDLWPTYAAPYTVDDAAVHHVFDGGWIWILRFNNGWTSAGVAATDRIVDRYKLAEGCGGWERLLDSLPMVKKQFCAATPTTSFNYLPQLSFMSKSISGDGWAMLPTAAGFVDPLLSTGIPLALLGISRIANILREDWDSPTFLTRLDQYAQETRGEIEAVAELIGGLYRNMAKFSVFRNLSLLYFAAASYAESARRLHKPHLTESFLLCNDHRFGPECRHILQLARGPLDEGEAFQLEECILKLIEPFDVAGLLKRPLNHCYPVRASDLLDSAHKLSATPSEIALLLERSGFFSAAEQVTWKQ